MKLVVTRRASRHLAGIFRHISADNPYAARRVLARIHLSLERLAAMPHIGRPGRIAGSRRWPVPGLPYIVVYFGDEATGELSFIAIYHGARGHSLPPD
ncbi:MAG TPA: type II toxin-antitoxin system RelE/ParE family toxin [Xanthobacteraceae bacterium]|nr:type II toxin-antitoxin system RelE/ParE family toxin [Xanthobacteraceae bacterium]